MIGICVNKILDQYFYFNYKQHVKTDNRFIFDSSHFAAKL